MEQAIKLAIEKGGYTISYETATICIAGTMEDPLFWQCLGKALGNKEEMVCDSPKCDSTLCEYAGYKDPKRMYDQYHELIWYGGDTEAFWKDLLPK